ncbi:DUF6257 family protein [Streptomyces sp. DH37]|uniref:DUF6257 family protein n=1 Tax=Streptomyces sp. DH37 TaxID=3040122 RepID=UPI002441AEFF|nr:DUF6257 family protein [Streptomyces sp. DH37]MDG9705529.1 DUF6257 family protein [Streptomyces sp. DH37]
MAHEPKLTTREKARVALLTARMVKRCVASEDIDRSDLEREVDAILDRAREREEQAAQQRP